MNSTCKTAVAAAVAGGYVLGRTRKAKVAFAIGTFLAGRRFGLTPTALAAEGMRQLKESPQLAGLREQIGGDLLDAVRAAATTSADRRFSAFADTLRERSRTEDGEEEPEDEEPEEPEDEEPEEPEDEEPEEPEDEEPEEPEDEEPEDESYEPKERPKRHSAKKTPARKKSAPAKKAPAKKAAAKKTASKKTASKKAAAKKTASGRSRSTSSRSGR